MPPNQAEHIEERLVALEIKASFNDDALDQLNAVIVRQQQQIDVLLRDVRELRSQAAQSAQASVTTRTASDELPPHY